MLPVLFGRYLLRSEVDDAEAVACHESPFADVAVAALLVGCLHVHFYSVHRVGVGEEFIEKIGENEKYDGTVKVYGDKDILSLTKGVAMFANPYTME